MKHATSLEVPRAINIGLERVSEITSTSQTTASEPMQQLFACPLVGCNDSFTRKDSIARHLQSRKHFSSFNQVSFECKICAKTFSREDHVTQHERRYHGVGDEIERPNNVGCMHDQCVGRLFRSYAELHKHIRSTHKETPFQCPVHGCERVGSNGWFRAHDRMVHQRRHHAGITQEDLGPMNGLMDLAIPAYLMSAKAKAHPALLSFEPTMHQFAYSAAEVPSRMPSRTSMALPGHIEWASGAASINPGTKTRTVHEDLCPFGGSLYLTPENDSLSNMPLPTGPADPISALLLDSMLEPWSY